MKQITSVLLFIFVFVFYANSQTAVLSLDGEVPSPLQDKSGYNTGALITVGNVVDSAGIIIIPKALQNIFYHYFKTDVFNGFNPNSTFWRVEFKVKLLNNQEDIFFIDWGSSSQTGHMRIMYNKDKGIHFSDRPVNGQNGAIITDSTVIPAGQWLSVVVEKNGSIYSIYRDGNLVKQNTNASLLTDATTTTVGYSEDDRPGHTQFYLDDFKVIINPLGVNETINTNNINLFPNPANDLILIEGLSPISVINIYDALGQLHITANNTTKMDVSGLSAGIYFVEILLFDKTKHVKRLVKD